MLVSTESTLEASSLTEGAPQSGICPSCPTMFHRAAAYGLTVGLPSSSVPAVCSWIALAMPRSAAVAGVECGTVGATIVATTDLARVRFAVEGTDAVALSRRFTPYPMRPLGGAVVC